MTYLLFYNLGISFRNLFSNVLFNIYTGWELYLEVFLIFTRSSFDETLNQSNFLDRSKTSIN